MDWTKKKEEKYFFVTKRKNFLSIIKKRVILQSILHLQKNDEMETEKKKGMFTCEI